MNILAPSILSADFGILGQQLKAIGDAGAEYVHIDVLDGKHIVQDRQRCRRVQYHAGFFSALADLRDYPVQMRAGLRVHRDNIRAGEMKKTALIVAGGQVDAGQLAEQARQGRSEGGLLTRTM